MEQERLEVVQGLYEALGRGDMDRAAKLIARTDWEEAEGMPYAGRYQGAEEVFQNVFGRIAADGRTPALDQTSCSGLGTTGCLLSGATRAKGAAATLM